MIEQRLADLERRLQQIEDERAIERLIASYGPLVDAGDPESTAALWQRGANYFHLKRVADPPGRWQIVMRITRMLDGAAESRALLVDGIAGRIR